MDQAAFWIFLLSIAFLYNWVIKRLPTRLRVIYLCIFLLSIAALYDQVTRRIPTRLCADQAPKSRLGLVLVGNYSLLARSYGIDIIFVHGLGSNPDTTWRARRPTATLDAVAESALDSEQYMNWVSDFLPNDLPTAIRKDTRIFFYNYDSYWKRDAVQTRLWNLGNELLEHISGGIRRLGEERSRGLIFVGYSYGGLVVKQALVQAQRSPNFANIAEHTKAILFLGTPHRGSSFSAWGRTFARALQLLGSNPSILAEVEYDSTSLLDLHRMFSGITRDDLQVVNFFEQRPTQILRLWFIHWQEFCVREQSATYDGRRVRNIGLPVDHFGLNKFGTRTESYQIILSKLHEIMTSMSQTIRRHYSVPLETVLSYTQRYELSKALEERLGTRRENASVPHAVAIHGLGGAGKSQVALKYAEDQKDRYNPILWIDATNEEAVRSSFERCAAELGLSVDRSETQRSALVDSGAVQAVLRWFRDRKDTDDRWLVVIDNADDFTWGLKKVIPKGKQGSVIITSRDKLSPMLVDGGCEQLEVDVMLPLEGRNLVLKHLQWDADSAPEKIRQSCDAVVQRLGYLPLAVDLAGAYISNDPDQEEAVMRYLADFDRHRDELLQIDDFRGLLPTEKTVWTVWDTTLEKLEREHAQLRPILFLAFLARFRGTIVQDEMFRLASLGIAAIDQHLGEEGQGLPSELRRFIEFDGGGWDSFLYRRSRDILLRYSLLQQVKGEWGGVMMHGLVQWRAMQYDPSQPWKWWYLVFALAACRQVAQEQQRPQFRRHLTLHLPDINEVEIPEYYRSFISSTLGRVYYDEGRWKEAEELNMQVMETDSRVLGAEHPDTLTSMANLASTFWNQGRWKEAEELFVQVMETRKRVFGAEHPDTLTSMANLASTYRNQGRWKEAEELFVQVMETSLRVFGAEHPDTLTSIANLASTFWNQGRWKEAEELEVQVMETRQRVLGAEHLDILTSMANLASTYRNQGRWKEAEELEVQVMEISLRVLGAEYPSTLTSMANLASTYRNQGRWKEAEELEVQVMETSLRVLGAEHPDTLTGMANLASTFWNQGRWKEAEELFVQVIETRKRLLGVEHPDTLASTANLASTYRNQGRWKEAEELNVQVIEISLRVLGAEHPDTLVSTANLASTYRNQGRWKEAEELEVQVIEISLRMLGAEHPDTLTSMANLALTFWNQGRWKEAEELNMQVMETRKRILGAEHPDTLVSTANLASTYRNQGRWMEAEELNVQVVVTSSKVLGAEHPDTLTSMANLASTYRNQGRWKEAEELEVQVMETSLRVLGAEHPNTLTSMANLASTFWHQWRWKEAEELNVQVMETRKRVLGAEHPFTLTSMANLASTYRNQGRWKEAEELEVQVMEIKKSVLGAEHPDTLASMANLASTYKNQGRWNEAEELNVQVMVMGLKVLGAEHPDTLTSMANLAHTWKSQGRNDKAITLLVKCYKLQKQILGPYHPFTLSSLEALNEWKME